MSVPLFAALIAQIYFNSIIFTIIIGLGTKVLLSLADYYVLQPRRRKSIRSLPTDDYLAQDRYPPLANRDYKPLSAKAPRSKGFQLTLTANLLHYFPFLRTLLRNQNHLNSLNNLFIHEAPTFIPRHFISENEERESKLNFEFRTSLVTETVRKQLQNISHYTPSDITRLTNYIGLDHHIQTHQNELKTSPDSFHFNTSVDYYLAYKTNKTTPIDVANRLIKALRESQDVHKLNAIVEWNEEYILQQAQESTRRFQEGSERSLLEGVPISLKDQIHCDQFKTSKGRSVFTKDSHNATAVQRLIQAGAIIYGKANQTEMGIHVTGMNANSRYKHCKNPYTLKHHTGGSSSGSGSAVAAGLGPISIGADGGGSIRLPSALCGVVGIKPTCGRVSLTGDTACYGSTVDVVGPIAASPIDAAICLAIISGKDDRDPITLHSPPIFEWSELTKLDRLEGVRIGVFQDWIQDSDAFISQRFFESIRCLEHRGAKIVQINIQEIQQMIIAHVTTITSEMYADEHLDIDYNPSSLTPPTQLLFEMMKDNTAFQYLQAAKMKTRVINQFLAILSTVDVIATASTGILPPPLPSDIPEGEEEADIQKQNGIMKYMHSANLTGLPAGTFPVGNDPENRPVGVQFIAGPWKEDLILRIGSVLLSNSIRSKPSLYYNLLADE